ncbi:integrase [Bordetella bronchiseptica]|uniref:tyrosine-type recombinase/integrase n=1 Tax=Bordetella bronchiseptica TaxID=518 RepID=UPI000E19E08E|nr:site-specific integrase [Bordetella bronchiseptica]SUW10766.1 integrase [Bordetella bronchiseptica]
MPIYRDKARSCLVFEFDRFIEGKRVRARKLLPKTWTRAQADAYDRQECARLYAIASGVQRPAFLIEDAVTVYLKEKAPTLKSGTGIEAELALMFWAYKGKPMDALSDVCREYGEKARKQNGDPLAPATLRNRIRYLTSACRYGWKRHGMHDRDPAERVTAPEVRNERRHFVNRAEMLAIAKACKCRRARAAIRIAFYSGMRLSEILEAERLDGMFVLADTKNGDPRHIPMHPKIRAAATVDPRNKWNVSKEFKAAAIAVGMGHLRFHDLRHSAASAMINAKVDLYTVGAVLGHRSAQSTKRYAHLATDSLRDALVRIGATKKPVKKSPTTKRKRAA